MYIKNTERLRFSSTIPTCSVLLAFVGAGPSDGKTAAARTQGNGNDDVNSNNTKVKKRKANKDEENNGIDGNVQTAVYGPPSRKTSMKSLGAGEGSSQHLRRHYHHHSKTN